MNKPVAWTDGRGNYFDKNSFFPVDGLIPLYTHPLKEPTDLELLKMIGEKFTRFGFEGDYVVEDSELVDFARAILRKASEKCNHSNFVKTEHLTGEGAMEYVEWFDNTCSDCGKHWTTDN